MDQRSGGGISHRFRTIKICPKDVACVLAAQSTRNRCIPLATQGAVMGDIIWKADQERQGWTRPSDIAWAGGYVIVTILLVLLWANVPA
jgi:hypothetical protein